MVVVITGASSGIGRALAIALAERGAHLVLAARRINRLQQLNTQLGGEHVCVQCDVAQEGECARLIQSAREYFGRIDTLVCNAGIGVIAPVWRMSASECADVFRTNVSGTISCIEAAVPSMLEQRPNDGWRGQIVIISSALARRALPSLGAYSATKAAQLAIAESLRIELRGSGIGVTSVHPVLTRTEFFRSAMRRSHARPPLRAKSAQSAEHVADCILQGIERPCPEVWTHSGYRWLLGLAGLFPRVADHVVASRQYRIDGQPSSIADGDMLDAAPQS